MRTRAIAVFAGGLLATMATAQAIPDAGIVIDVDNPELMPGQSTTVTMSAARPTGTWAQASLTADLNISSGGDGWTDLEILPPFWLPFSSEGTTGPSGIEGILAGKLNFPPAGTPADNNPIAFWRATFTAPADVAAPFAIDLGTLTTRYDIYVTMDDTRGSSILDEVVEGQATIRVIPAPAGTLVLGLGLLSARRQRRN